MQEAQQLTAPASPKRNLLRAVVGGLVILAAAALAGLAIYRKRAAFVDALDRIGPAAMLASLVAGAVAALANFPVWRSVLRGYEVNESWRLEARVFFISQLGKYLPGAIWPLVIQVQALRNASASRRTVIGVNLITIVLGCAVGLVVSCALLPLSDTAILASYWWVLLALPLLVALLHPRVVPAIVNRALAITRRPGTVRRLDLPSTMRAAGWSLISWLALGAHVSFLALAVGGGGLRTLLLCTGGASLAVAAGILAVPVPAGVGIRDSILGLVLAVNLSAGEAIAVVVASRVMLIVLDVVLAGIATVLRPVPRIPTTG